MKNKKLFYSIIFLGLLPLILSANKVIHAPGSITSLDDGWDWAIKSTRGDSVFYVGYTIRRLMNEDSHIGSWRGKNQGYVTLHELITGKKVDKKNQDKQVSEMAREVLNRKKEGKGPGKKVLKDVAFLHRFDAGARSKFACQSIIVSSLDMHVDLKKGNIYWLGKSDKGSSIRFLDRLFDKTSIPKIRKTVIMAVSMHGGEPGVVPFLKKVFHGKYDPDLKGDAIFWMGQVKSEESVNALLEIYAKTGDPELQKKLIFAFSQHHSKKATDKLAAIARKDKSSKAREQAIFWLGQKKSKESVKILSEIYDDTDDLGIKDKLIFAFSQGGGEAIDKLLIIAGKDPDRKARKKAIFWLGQSENPKAWKFLEDILNEK